MPTHAPMTHATSTLPDSRSQDFRAFSLQVQCAQFLLKVYSSGSRLVLEFLDLGVHGFATLLLFRRKSEPQVRSGHSQAACACCGTPRDLSAAGSGRVCVHRHCSVGLCAVSSKPAPSSSRGTPLAPHEPQEALRALFSALECG